jgi:nuclear pore complex protein Nup160
VNSAELLRSFLDYDLLEEAVNLVLEMIDGVCGKGKEYFGLKTFLHAGAPAVWLPYTAIDQLLLALRDVRTEPHYTEVG